MERMVGWFDRYLKSDVKADVTTNETGSRR
jgi:hypothetical protein